MGNDFVYKLLLLRLLLLHDWHIHGETGIYATFIFLNSDRTQQVMCAILGIFNSSVADYKAALSSMRNRGLDNAGVWFGKTVHSKHIESLPPASGKFLIAHLLHAMVGCVPEPIQKKGVLAANCEIYNWEYLAEKYGLESANDADLLIDLIEKKRVQDVESILSDLDGVYSFCYFSEGQVILARDILGVKPLWYSHEEGLSFASEKKALVSLGKSRIEELNPRMILQYDTHSDTITFRERPFFSLTPALGADFAVETEKLLTEAILKRTPKSHFGILFSGGIDSVFIAKICQELGASFTCYTSAVQDPGAAEAHDLVAAKRAAEFFGFALKTKTLSCAEVEGYLKKIVPLIEDNNVVKVGVALPFFVACELAREDGIKAIFSGLGSEEIFAGYERHKKSSDINKECLFGLLKMYERDLYRDDVITMNNNIELRLPFLDKTLVSHSLRIPSQFKISDGRDKIVLRDIAKNHGIPDEFAERKKKAAQYGSGFDRCLAKLARQKKCQSKSELLAQIHPHPNMKLGVLWSTGKDSAYATYLMKRQNYEISALISISSKNPDSFMFHTPNVHLSRLHAQAMNTPLVSVETSGEKEKELSDLGEALRQAKERHHIDGIVTGALFSSYQRDRIELICDKLSLKIFSPLWHMDQEQEMRNLLREGFSFIFTRVAALGLDKSWLGRIIETEDINRLARLHDSYGTNVAGEGGETESLVLDCPLFRQKLVIGESNIRDEGPHAATLDVLGCRLAQKALAIIRSWP